MSIILKDNKWFCHIDGIKNTYTVKQLTLEFQQGRLDFINDIHLFKR
jgi:hypothetical protein